MPYFRGFHKLAATFDGLTRNASGLTGPLRETPFAQFLNWTQIGHLHERSMCGVAFRPSSLRRAPHMAHLS